MLCISVLEIACPAGCVTDLVLLPVTATPESYSSAAVKPRLSAAAADDQAHSTQTPPVRLVYSNKVSVIRVPLAHDG